MTARSFIEMWEEATSHLRNTARAAKSVRDPDVNPELLEEMRNACIVSADMLDFTRRKYDRRTSCAPDNESSHS